MSVLSTIDILQKVACHTESRFQSEYGGAMMTWNPDVAIGTTMAYEIIPGISTIVHDLIFHEDFAITEDRPATDQLNLVYCLEGHLYHKFEEDSEYTHIPAKQNIIVYNSREGKNHVLLPKGVPIKLTNVYIFKSTFEAYGKQDKGFFGSGLNDIFNAVRSGGPYRHIGPLNNTIFQYTGVLFNKSKLDFIGRLRIEAAILNIIAAQFDTYLKFDNQSVGINGLSKSDLNAILELSNYIAANLFKRERVSELAKRSGLHAKKLQAGFRYYFGVTLNVFIHNLRMAKAKELMEITDLSLDEICTQIGFQSRSYLSRTFLEYYGTSPREYRNSIKNIAPVYEMIYLSNLKMDLDHKDIDQIVQTSKVHNYRLNITGCLVCSNNRFFQILEGEKVQVDALYAKIRKDNRHYNTELIWQGFKAKRTFKKWSMAYIDITANTALKLDGLPFERSVESLLGVHQNSSTISRRFWERIKEYLIVSSAMS